MAVLQVPRATDFSPLKNAPGSKDGDSPDTSRADILKLHAGYLKAAGVTIVRGSSDTADVPVVEVKKKKDQ